VTIADLTIAFRSATPRAGALSTSEAIVMTVDQLSATLVVPPAHAIVCVWLELHTVLDKRIAALGFPLLHSTVTIPSFSDLIVRETINAI